jgi:hypothetical protein
MSDALYNDFSEFSQSASVNIRAEITLILFLKINEKYGERYKNILFYVATHLSKIKLWNTSGLFPCSLIPYSRNTREINWKVLL